MPWPSEQHENETRREPQWQRNPLTRFVIPCSIKLERGLLCLMPFLGSVGSEAMFGDKQILYANKHRLLVLHWEARSNFKFCLFLLINSD